MNSVIPMSAATPAAASGPDSAMLRRICSRDSWLGERRIPWAPIASSSCARPARSISSGIPLISSSTPRLIPISVALRAQNPSGSGSRSIDGTTVSQTAASTLRSASPST